MKRSNLNRYAIFAGVLILLSILFEAVYFLSVVNFKEHFIHLGADKVSLITDTFDLMKKIILCLFAFFFIKQKNESKLMITFGVYMISTIVYNITFYKSLAPYRLIYRDVIILFFFIIIFLNPKVNINIFKSVKYIWFLPAVINITFYSVDLFRNFDFLKEYLKYTAQMKDFVLNEILFLLSPLVMIAGYFFIGLWIKEKSERILLTRKVQQPLSAKTSS